MSQGPTKQDIGNQINNSVNKATPADVDKFGYWDSVALHLAYLTHLQLKTVLKAFFDTLYAAGAGSPLGNNVILFTNGSGQIIYSAGWIIHIGAGAGNDYDIRTMMGMDGELNYAAGIPLSNYFTTPMDVVADQQGTMGGVRGVAGFQAAANEVRPFIFSLKGRGTRDIPTHLLLNDLIGIFTGWGYATNSFGDELLPDGSTASNPDHYDKASVRFYADEDWDVNSEHMSRIELWTTPQVTEFSERTQTIYSNKIRSEVPGVQKNTISHDLTVASDEMTVWPHGLKCDALLTIDGEVNIL